jgi:SAM-dependent methyltransferase
MREFAGRFNDQIYRMVGSLHRNCASFWTGRPGWATLLLTMRRTLQPEILDSLAPDDPDALHNRRDLRIINAIMGNPRWIERSVLRQLQPDDRVLELGSGTGELGRRLMAAGIPVDGLDLWPRPANWPPERAWHQADLRTFAGYQDYDVIVANLILHQFTAAELADLGRRLLQGRARLILACEPRRNRLSQLLCAVFAPLLGVNYVTRHDARVSIAAGFRAAELPAALGLAGPDWAVRCHPTFIGAYRLSALRRDRG